MPQGDGRVFKHFLRINVCLQQTHFYEIRVRVQPRVTEQVAFSLHEEAEHFFLRIPRTELFFCLSKKKKKKRTKLVDFSEYKLYKNLEC